MSTYLTDKDISHCKFYNHYQPIVIAFDIEYIVIAYEKEHYPIEKPTVSELIELSLEEKGMTQRQLASEIGVSPSRINDYISGRSEPTLKIARLLCRLLNIPPAAMLGF